MIVVPQVFAETRIGRNGGPGRAWVEALPGLAERFCDRWGLEVTGPALHGDVNLVLPVRRGGEACVLKLCWPEHNIAGEASALRAWNGRGAVRLLEESVDEGGLLLERLDSGRSLRDLPLLTAAGIAGALIRQLAVPAPAGLLLLVDIAGEFADSAHHQQESLGAPLPARWVDLAVGLAVDLAADAGTWAVHADLHYGNVLAARRAPWLVIDPKAVAGDPEYSVPELMWTRLDEAEDATGVRTLLATLVDAGGLDAARARAWTIVRAVDYWLWGLGAGLTEDPVRCRRLLDTLA
ncbi:aminoglycoside phosphotransferase family protein [Actinopolymorpha alba]|uniref:aminoglycoside phosphotransferase family protein n=1 Tax=Actinopolymorpha alba TaxID=533267 RepID=UPI0003610C97|nr:aminoglycoside phosphotransferase family protein [Actinopolymorpha alba]